MLAAPASEKGTITEVSSFRCNVSCWLGAAAAVDPAAAADAGSEPTCAGCG